MVVGGGWVVVGVETNFSVKLCSSCTIGCDIIVINLVVGCSCFNGWYGVIVVFNYVLTYN